MKSARFWFEVVCAFALAGLLCVLLGFAMIGYVESSGPPPLSLLARWGFGLVGFGAGVAVMLLAVSALTLWPFVEAAWNGRFFPNNER